jgi:replicative DNA helicase
MLTDAAAERAVLAGITRYGSEGYFDVADIISNSTFTVEANSIIYNCCHKIIGNDTVSKIDVPSILSASKELGLDGFFANQNELQHLNAIFKFPVAQQNIRKFAAKIRKLEIARLMHEQLELTQEKYTHIKGDEPLSHILGLAEESIFDFTSLLNDEDDSPQLVFGDIEEYLEDKAANPVDQIGISTGWPKFDFAIGGGLRKGTVNVIGARPKVGKTLVAMNMGIDIASRGIPVLNLDTEMRRQDHQDRGTAMISYSTKAKTTINQIETGKFGKSDYQKNTLLNKMKGYKQLPYYHKNIGGKPFEDQLSIMRRWLSRTVGLNDRGKANDCVIIYDYLKLMDSLDMQAAKLAEFQMLGFMMTSLHNFSLRYEVPVLLFIQLNRDGITKESTDTASGSDRVIWLCSNFSIYKTKSDEEIAQDGEAEGDRKLVQVIGRHGEGLASGDYINIKMHGKYAKLIEKNTARELNSGKNNDKEQDNSNYEDVAF